MANRAFTAQTIKSLSYSRNDDHPQFEWDSKTIGLGVRLTKGGAKSYVLRYRIHNRQRITTLGDTQLHSLDAARMWARDALAKADHDEDFRDERRRKNNQQSIANLWQTYMNEHVIPRSSQTSIANLNTIWRVHLEKPFGPKRPSELSASEIRSWHRKLSTPSDNTGKKTNGGPYAANRALEALTAAINFHIRNGDNAWPLGQQNPCNGVTANPESSRQVILEPSQAPKLAEAINAYPDLYIRNYLWLILLTAARRTELLKLQWKDVNLSSKTITFLDTKNQHDHKLPLADRAVEILKATPRLQDNPYVFPGRHGRGHRVNVKDAWATIRAAAGLPHLHLHDLRRTAGSWLGAAGYTSNMIGELLNHKSDITSRVYVQLGNLDVKKRLAEQQAELVSRAISQPTIIINDDGDSPGPQSPI